MDLRKEANSNTFRRLVYKLERCADPDDYAQNSTETVIIEGLRDELRPFTWARRLRGVS